VLSWKLWKPDAIVRLLLGVFICIYAGALAICVAHYLGHHGRRNPGFWPLAIGAFGFLAAALVLGRRGWRLENLLRRMVAMLTCFYLGLTLGALAQRIAGTPSPSVGITLIAALSFQGGALTLVALFLREHEVGWREAFGFAHQWPSAVRQGLLLAACFLPVGWGLQWLSARGLDFIADRLAPIFPRLDLRPEEQAVVQTLQMAASWSSRAALGVVTILLAPVAEETLFRGILYPAIKQAGFPRLALWGTSLLFAAVHTNLVTFIPLTLLACALALLYERTDNLAAPISAHALFNAFNFVLLYVLQKFGD